MQSIKKRAAFYVVAKNLNISQTSHQSTRPPLHLHTKAIRNCRNLQTKFKTSFIVYTLQTDLAAPTYGTKQTNNKVRDIPFYQRMEQRPQATCEATCVTPWTSAHAPGRLGWNWIRTTYLKLFYLLGSALAMGPKTIQLCTHNTLIFLIIGANKNSKKISILCKCVVGWLGAHRWLLYGQARHAVIQMNCTHCWVQTMMLYTIF